MLKRLFKSLLLFLIMAVSLPLLTVVAVVEVLVIAPFVYVVSGKTYLGHTEIGDMCIERIRELIKLL